MKCILLQLFPRTNRIPNIAEFSIVSNSYTFTVCNTHLHGTADETS